MKHEDERVGVDASILRKKKKKKKTLKDVISGSVTRLRKWHLLCVRNVGRRDSYTHQYLYFIEEGIILSADICLQFSSTD
jgi:hypothetical protein